MCLASVTCSSVACHQTAWSQLCAYRIPVRPTLRSTHLSTCPQTRHCSACGHWIARMLCAHMPPAPPCTRRLGGVLGHPSLAPIPVMAQCEAHCRQSCQGSCSPATTHIQQIDLALRLLGLAAASGKVLTSLAGVSPLRCILHCPSSQSQTCL